MVVEIAGEVDFKVVGSGVEVDVSHQRMEVTAVLKALEWLAAQVPQPQAVIVSDSYYVVGCFQFTWYLGWERRGWRNSRGKEPKYLDLWRSILAVYSDLEAAPQFVHVRGHQGNAGNEAADKICTSSLKAAIAADS